MSWGVSWSLMKLCNRLKPLSVLQVWCNWLSEFAMATIGGLKQWGSRVGLTARIFTFTSRLAMSQHRGQGHSPKRIWQLQRGCGDPRVQVFSHFTEKYLRPEDDHGWMEVSPVPNTFLRSHPEQRKVYSHCSVSQALGQWRKLTQCSPGFGRDAEFYF